MMAISQGGESASRSDLLIILGLLCMTIPQIKSQTIQCYECNAQNKAAGWEPDSRCYLNPAELGPDAVTDCDLTTNKCGKFYTKSPEEEIDQFYRVCVSNGQAFPETCDDKGSYILCAEYCTEDLCNTDYVPDTTTQEEGVTKAPTTTPAPSSTTPKPASTTPDPGSMPTIPDNAASYLSFSAVLLMLMPLLSYV